MFFGLPGTIEIVLLLGLGGGVGLPLGVPPAPEDPLLAKVAPEECLFYMSSAGVAEPDADSKNHTEKLLAEPEVQHLITELEKQIKAAVVEAAKRDDPGAVPLVEDAAEWVKILLTRPTVLFLSSVEIGSHVPDVQGGALVRVGDDAAKLKATLEKHQAAFLPGMAQPVQVAGDTWYKLQLDPDAPEITWGVRGKYLIVGIGKGSVAGLLERAVTPAPEWLTKLREQLPVDRTSTVTYVNVQSIIENFGPMGGPQVVGFLSASGLNGVTSLASVTGLDEEAFVSRTLIGLSGEPRGLLSFAAGKPLTAADLAAIPADADVAVAARINADAIFESFLALVGTVEPRGREEVERGLAEMKRELGIDLRNDIFKALGDGWCVYNSPGEGGLLFTGATAVVPVKDYQTLSATHQRLIAVLEAEFKQQEEARRAYAEERRAQGRYYRMRPSPRIEKFQHAGKDVYFFNARDDDVPFAPAWCLSEKEVIFALFPQSIKAYLTRGEGHKSLAEVPEVAAMLQPGDAPLAMMYLDTPRLFELVYPLVPMFAQVVLGELQREGIDISVSILPTAQSIGKHLRPNVSAVKRTPAGIEIIGRQTIPGAGLGAAMPVMMFPLLFFSHADMPVEVYEETMEIGDATDEAIPAPAIP